MSRTSNELAALLATVTIVHKKNLAIAVCRQLKKDFPEVHAIISEKVCVEMAEEMPDNPYGTKNAAKLLMRIIEQGIHLKGDAPISREMADTLEELLTEFDNKHFDPGNKK